MAKKPEEATVKVVLKCIHTGIDQTWNPGDVLETDAREAERLVGLGAAKAYEPPAEPATE